MQEMVSCFGQTNCKIEQTRMLSFVGLSCPLDLSKKSIYMSFYCVDTKLTAFGMKLSYTSVAYIIILMDVLLIILFYISVAMLSVVDRKTEYIIQNEII